MLTLPAAHLLFALLTVAPVPAAAGTWDVVGTRHLEARMDPVGQEQRVRISPHHTTTFVFNAPLLPGGVVVEGPEIFGVVSRDEAQGIITLLPSGELPLGRELRLTVRFTDGALPASAAFRLVVRATGAESQVNVNRQPRSGESYQVEARQERERAEACEAELARARAEQRPPGGFVGLIEDGWVKGEQGIEARNFLQATRQRPGEAIHVTEAYSYRAQGRRAVALEVKNTSAQPWTVDSEGALLVSDTGARLRVVRVWPLEPLAPEEERRLIVEAETGEEEPGSTYRLQLGEAEGARTITLRGVLFP
ncbi:DUF2381 family protein [Archangium sp.]|uniref:DUF2381 family protein n=1 Tax=Archangium sp. TaxID=1872627 RepID=UPI00286BCB64|nr:DUF2381 family protein [Archangium sp.]